MHLSGAMIAARVLPTARMDCKWPGNERNDCRKQLQWSGPEGIEMGSTWIPLTAQLGRRNRVGGRVKRPRGWEQKADMSPSA